MMRTTLTTRQIAQMFANGTWADARGRIHLPATMNIDHAKNTYNFILRDAFDYYVAACSIAACRHPRSFEMQPGLVTESALMKNFEDRFEREERRDGFEEWAAEIISRLVPMFDTRHAQHYVRRNGDSEWVDDFGQKVIVEFATGKVYVVINSAMKMELREDTLKNVLTVMRLRDSFEVIS